MNKNTLTKPKYILYNLLTFIEILIFLLLNKCILHIFITIKTKRFLVIIAIYTVVICLAIIINFRKRRNGKLIIIQFIIAIVIAIIALPRIHFNEMDNDPFKEKIDLNSKQYYMQYFEYAHEQMIEFSIEIRNYEPKNN